MTAYADVLLVTVNPHETQAVLQAFQEATGKAATPVPLEDRVYRDLGTVNGTRVFHALSEMGSGGPGATQQTVDKAIRAVNPGAVIGIGIAFGVNEKKQAIGDILISKQLRLYDLNRAGSEIVLRGDKPHASTRLINFFEGVAQTSWGGSQVRPGVILTGESLVDDLDYRDQLIRFEPEAVGGEMEGAGLYVASDDQKVDWIVIKAICDWGDGQKKKNKEARQKKAATNAAQFVLHALQQSPMTRGPSRHDRSWPASDPRVKNGVPHKNRPDRFLVRELDSAAPDSGQGITVKRVMDPTSEELLEALVLYKERIPDPERFEESDIIRWIRDDLEADESAALRPRDYFLVAKLKGRVCGFILFHYYPKAGLGFIAYLVVARGLGIHSYFNDSVSARLLTAVNRLLDTQPELGQCNGLLLEVDRPLPVSTEQEWLERQARIRLFCMLAEQQGFSLRAFDMDYYHPPLSLDSDSAVPMLLMYLKPRALKPRSHMNRREVRRILKFIYTDLYPENYSECGDENRAYKTFLRNLYLARSKTLPERISMLGSKQLKTYLRRADGANLPSSVKPDAAVLRGPGWNNPARLSDATSKAKKHRTPTSHDVVAEVLATSRRRCCVCFALRNDGAERKGQIAHLDHNPSHNTPDNLAFLCLEHHDQYDSRTSQSKGLTIDELKRYRTELLASFHHHTNTNDHPDSQKKGNEEPSVRLERLKRARYHVETRLRKRGGHRASYEVIRNEVDETYSDEFLNQLIERNPKIFGRCRIKKGNKQGITLVEAEPKVTLPLPKVDAPTPTD